MFLTRLRFVQVPFFTQDIPRVACHCGLSWPWSLLEYSCRVAYIHTFRLLAQRQCCVSSSAFSGKTLSYANVNCCTLAQLFGEWNVVFHTNPVTCWFRLVCRYPVFPDSCCFATEKRQGIGCHHPKIFLLPRKNSIRVIVTSANLTRVQVRLMWEKFPITYWMMKNQLSINYAWDITKTK